MGLLYADARRLLAARQSGVSFGRTLTVSRQQLYLHKAELETLRGIHPDGGSWLEGYQFGEYADRFFREVIGVGSLATIDMSVYEGAIIVHDLNHPVPQELRESFDVVVEAGSLEHIFSFPTAIANLMKVVRVGGTVFLILLCYKHNRC